MTEQELCGEPHPMWPHRTCLRTKGHVNGYTVAGILLATPTHADYAGTWKGEDD